MLMKNVPSLDKFSTSVKSSDAKHRVGRSRTPCVNKCLLGTGGVFKKDSGGGCDVNIYLKKS